LLLPLVLFRMMSRMGRMMSRTYNASHHHHHPSSSSSSSDRRNNSHILEQVLVLGQRWSFRV